MSGLMTQEAGFSLLLSVIVGRASAGDSKSSSSKAVTVLSMYASTEAESGNGASAGDHSSSSEKNVSELSARSEDESGDGEVESIGRSHQERKEVMREKFPRDGSVWVASRLPFLVLQMFVYSLPSKRQV